MIMFSILHKVLKGFPSSFEIVYIKRKAILKSHRYYKHGALRNSIKSLRYWSTLRRGLYNSCFHETILAMRKDMKDMKLGRNGTECLVLLDMQCIVIR